MWLDKGPFNKCTVSVGSLIGLLLSVSNSTLIKRNDDFMIVCPAIAAMCDHPDTVQAYLGLMKSVGLMSN